MAPVSSHRINSKQVRQYYSEMVGKCKGNDLVARCCFSADIQWSFGSNPKWGAQPITQWQSAESPMVSGSTPDQTHSVGAPVVSGRVVLISSARQSYVRKSSITRIHPRKNVKSVQQVWSHLLFLSLTSNLFKHSLFHYTYDQTFTNYFILLSLLPQYQNHRRNL